MWSEERAWDWYRSVPFPRGTNFIGKDCANRRDMWQSWGREERLREAEREIALSEELGFNSVRVILDFDVYLQEPESFLSVLEEYLRIFARHRHTAMIVLAHEAELPRGPEEPFVPKPLGEQEYALGYHMGRRPLTPEEAAKSPYHWLERAELVRPFLQMVADVVTRYRDDPRVLCWNVYNEPGIVIGARSVPLLEKLFALIREIGPVQPLTADVWRGMKDGAPATAEERWALAHSDVVSFHSYARFPSFARTCEELQKAGRPMFCTEWLHRINHNDVDEVYPFLHYARIASYCWGFVLGKTQTNEPWDVLWEHYEKDRNVGYDFTKWQHDLFRPNFRPYDPREIELIRQYNTYADERDRREGRL